MNKMYQVFISSTYSDLKEERQLISEYLAKANHIPAGMELFPATDQQQLEFIKTVIDRCDYYVVVIGGRYGSLADDNLSYTEKEFEYALEKGIPVLAFLHKNPDTIPVGKTDRDDAKALRLQQFCMRLSTGRVVYHWHDAHELAGNIVIALGQQITLKPGLGWIRGDQAIDPRLLQELALLRSENARLKERLADIEGSELTFDPRYAGPEFKPPYEIELRNKTIQSRLSLGELFVGLYDDLMPGPNEHRLRYLIALNTAKLMGQSSPGDGGTVKQSTVAMIRNHFEALGLIESKPADSADTARWTLTPKGKKFAANFKVMPNLN